MEIFHVLTCVFCLSRYCCAPAARDELEVKIPECLWTSVPTNTGKYNEAAGWKERIREI